MRLVMIGYGFSCAAIAREITPHCAGLHVTARGEEKVARLRGEGLDASRFDGTFLSDGLAQALAHATHLLVSAPPDENGDPLLRTPGFTPRAVPQLNRIAYLSTVGIYGDHQGRWVDEDSVPNPVSRRSHQRLAAEMAWQDLARGTGVELGIFRLSGIYGPGRSAIDNLRAGTARRIVKPGQVFNRIHVLDIAGALTKALTGNTSLGILNLTDDEPCPPQDVVAHAAAMLKISPPPETPFEKADLSPMGRSFYGENKRVSNARIKARLGYTFRCPTYREGLIACLGAQVA